MLLCSCSDYGFHDGEDTKVDTGDPGVPGDTVEEAWDLEEAWGSDIVFFGDTSGSMTEELQTLGDQVTEFIGHLDDFTQDWQLLAVTGPDGCGINGVLTPDTSDYAALFAEAILTSPGIDEVDEWGLYNAAMAVELGDSGECNDGFMRDNTMLSVVFISDEDDNSPGWDSGDDEYWQAYVDEIVAHKGSEEAVALSAVAGPVPDGCEGAEPGYGYSPAVEATGGEFLSICDPWYDELEVLAEVATRREVFELSNIPVESTITVAVNDHVRTGDWEYDSVLNAVRFTAHHPQSGDEVLIRYEIAE